MGRFPVVLGLSILLVPSIGLSQDDPSWVGRKIVRKYQAPLKSDSGVLEADPAFRVYKVDRVDGDRLRIVVEGKTFWIAARDVLPLDQAISFYNDELKLKPTSLAYRMRGNVWLAKEDYDRAAEDFSQAIRLDPRDARALNARGWTWTNKNEHDKALLDVSEAIRLDPKLAMAFCNRGAIWLRKNEYDKAIADMSEAVRLNPQSAEPFVNRGIVWLERKEHDKAVADFNEAIRLDPDCVRAFDGRGCAWFEQGNHDKAIADFTQAIRLNPLSVQSFFNRGHAWNEKANYVRAIADYNQAIRLNPKDSTAFYERGVAWAETLDYERAIPDFTEAIRLDPKYACPHSALARIWATSPDTRYRNIEKAVAAGAHACELSEWKDVFCLETLALAYNESGDFDKAVETQEKAIKLLPEGDARQRSESQLTQFKFRKLLKDKG